MNEKKLIEKELLEGMTSYISHSDLIAKSEKKPDWVSFADGADQVTDDFMASRNELFDGPSLGLVNPDIFLSNLKSALNCLPDGDVELGDLGNEIGRVIASLNSPHQCHLRDVLYGIEHGFDLIVRTRGVGNE